MGWVAEWNARGPEGKQGKKGDRGLPGLEDVPTDPGVAELITAGRDSETGTAVLRMAHRPELVNPKGLDRFRKFLGELLFFAKGAIFQGDSLTDGAWANNAPTKTVADQQRWADGGFVGQMRRLIAATYGYPGEGLINFTPDDSRWTIAGSATAVAIGVASTGRRFVTGSSATITLVDGTTSADVLGMFYPGAGVPLAYVDDAEATPSVLTGGAAAMTSGWGALNGTVSYVTEGTVPVVQVVQSAAGALLMHAGLGLDAAPAIPGEWMLIQAQVKPTTNNRDVLATALFYDAAGAIIPGTEVMGDYRSALVNGYMQVAVIAQVPAGAARIALGLRVNGSIVGDTYRIRWAKSTRLRRMRDGALGARFYSYRVPLSSGAHALRLQTGTGVLTDMVGIIANGDPNAKLRIHGSALSGSTTRDHALPSISADGRTNLMIGTYLMPEAEPALVVIMLGANDYNRQDTQSITPTEYKANLQLLINTITDTGASTLLIAGPRWADDSKTFSQDDFYAKARELALSNAHVSFFDLKEAWGDWDSADAKGFMYDSPHPNLAGHGDLARIVWNVITRPTEPE